MIAEQLKYFQDELAPAGCKLVPVSKTKPNELLLEAYNAGCKVFGENKVQELATKYEELPKDIEWHFIGHLQRNKVKYIAGFVHLIHAVDSLRLLNTINKEAAKHNRSINCLLQVHIASEESKFGFSENEVIDLIANTDWSALKNIRIIGLMGMATFTPNTDQVRSEFKILSNLKNEIEKMDLPDNIAMQELSMGMTNDYKIALEEGSTMVRIGTAIFGARNCKIDE
jgi:pyridoxal phosphate enzyme (YggS family)